MSGGFKSFHQAMALHCSYKAAEGHLFPLEKGFVFVNKPPMHIRFDDIGSVAFDRVNVSRGESSRSFDIIVCSPAMLVFTLEVSNGWTTD